MNTRLFLTSNFKNIAFKKDKNNKTIIYYNKNKNIFTSENNKLTLYRWNRYFMNFYDNKIPFLLFGLIWFIGNKAGKYIAKKYIFKQEDAKLFVLSNII